MELTEIIESLNKQLKDEYGLDTSTNQPMFRIVWANNQYEKRLVSETPEGIRLLVPQVMELHKYPYLKGFYVLERLVIIPIPNQHELPEVKLSYEPIWTFSTPNHEYLPPTWEASKFIVDILYAALGKVSAAKYKESAEQLSPEARDERIKALQEELFGNETEVTDALAHKEAVVVPNKEWK